MDGALKAVDALSAIAAPIAFGACAFWYSSTAVNLSANHLVLAADRVPSCILPLAGCSN
jgi:hypothetical protein